MQFVIKLFDNLLLRTKQTSNKKDKITGHHLETTIEANEDSVHFDITLSCFDDYECKLLFDLLYLCFIGTQCSLNFATSFFLLILLC